jgi:nucleotide-binding universal stress UspA family protein
MIRNILVCLEGSPSGARAVDLAMKLAHQLGARLAGLAIVDEPDIRAGAATGIGGASYKRQRDDALVADAERHAQEWLAAFSARCRQEEVPARTVEERGRPAATILEEMQEHDLVLMGRDANFKFETAASDRQTRDAILHRARRPVIVVPEQAPVESPRVMLAFDGSSASRRAVRSFGESGLAEGSELFVATVDDHGAAAWEMASRAVEMLRQMDLPAEPRNLVSTHSIAEALLAERAHLGARMLAMGAYARSRLVELVWGSITQELLEKTTVPLYLHH